MSDEGGRARWIVRAVTFAIAWFVAYVVLSLPAVLLDAWSGLRLQYRPGAYNLFTLTLALAAVPAVFLAWQIPRWLRL